jgi:hypothetical protein
MPKKNLRSMDRRGAGFWFFAALAAVLFAAYSLAMAATTADDCDGAEGRRWQYIPPKWECTGRGFG